MTKFSRIIIAIFGRIPAVFRFNFVPPRWSARHIPKKRNLAFLSDMFKLPALPSARAGVHELADFAELLAWQRDFVSIREILSYLGQLGDNEYNEGVNDEDDQNADALDEVMVEIDRRAKSCGSGYPFLLDMRGNVVRHQADDNSDRADFYRYLLLSTRLNMTKKKVQDGIDGQRF